MSGEKKIFLITAISILLIFVGGYYFYSNLFPDSKIYKNLEFGFSFLYPPLLKASSTGPNIAQQQINAGEVISGTIPPSFDTVLFVENENKEWFRVEIFHKLQIPLTPDMIYYQCDNQFDPGGKEHRVNQLRYINHIPVLERKSFFNEYKTWSYFYCFQNLESNLIVISSTFLEETKASQVDVLLLEVIGSIKLFPKE